MSILHRTATEHTDDDEDDDEVELIFSREPKSAIAETPIASVGRLKSLFSKRKQEPQTTRGNPYKSLNDIVAADHVEEDEEDDVIANFALFQVCTCLVLSSKVVLILPLSARDED